MTPSQVRNLAAHICQKYIVEQDLKIREQFTVMFFFFFGVGN